MSWGPMALNNVLDGGQPYSEKHLGQLLPSACCSLVSAVPKGCGSHFKANLQAYLSPGTSLWPQRGCPHGTCMATSWSLSYWTVSRTTRHTSHMNCFDPKCHQEIKSPHPHILPYMHLSAMYRTSIISLDTLVPQRWRWFGVYPPGSKSMVEGIIGHIHP